MGKAITNGNWILLLSIIASWIDWIGLNETNWRQYQLCEWQNQALMKNLHKKYETLMNNLIEQRDSVEGRINTTNTNSFSITILPNSSNLLKLNEEI